MPYVLRRQTCGAFHCLVQAIATEDRQNGTTWELDDGKYDVTQLANQKASLPVLKTTTTFKECRIGPAFGFQEHIQNSSEENGKLKIAN